MDQRRLSVADIAIGEPLPWDVYGEGEKLLLRRGHIVQNLSQVDSLLVRGLFVDADTGERLNQEIKEAKHAAEPKSALYLILQSAWRLEKILYNFSNETDVEKKIYDIVEMLNDAANVNEEITLASILVNQSSAKYAVRHCIDTALLAQAIARAMKKPLQEIRTIMAAALTMNIGMLRQHDQLMDREDPLTESDLAVIRDHTRTGVEMLQTAGVSDEQWLKHVELHHENDEGTGYPQGNAITDVPQNTKILAFADRYCAAVARRKYKKTLLPLTALRDVLLSGGKPSDPMLAAYFIKELCTYPPGSFVRLQNGEIGVVTRRAKNNLPYIVQSFIGPRGAPLSVPIRRDTSRDLYTILEPIPNQQATLCFSMQQLWGDEAAP